MGRKKKKRKRPDEHDPRLPIENGRPFIDVCGLGGCMLSDALAPEAVIQRQYLGHIGPTCRRDAFIMEQKLLEGREGGHRLRKELSKLIAADDGQFAHNGRNPLESMPAAGHQRQHETSGAHLLGNLQRMQIPRKRSGPHNDGVEELLRGRPG